jgi:hypothetical protein
MFSKGSSATEVRAAVVCHIKYLFFYLHVQQCYEASKRRRRNHCGIPLTDGAVSGVNVDIIRLVREEDGD